MPYKDFGLEVLTSSDLNTYAMQQTIIRCTSGTRPSSPSEGWHIYETDTRRLLVYKSGSWVMAIPTDLTAIKNTDETYSAGVYHDDPVLKLPLWGNSTFLLTGMIVAQVSTGTGFNLQFSWSVPSGASMRYMTNHPVSAYSNGSTVNVRYFSAGDAVNMRVQSFTDLAQTAHLFGTVVTGSTPGTLQFRWVNITNPVTIRGDSFIQLRQVS
jgi:hypothetical protein